MTQTWNDWRWLVDWWLACCSFIWLLKPLQNWLNIIVLSAVPDFSRDPRHSWDICIPFQARGRKKVESMAWTWDLNGPILQYDAMMHHGGTGHLDLSRYLCIYIYESRAETHERFYIIEVHRHRFEMSARKVPFEKCTRWRKVCGRSAKDQIGDSIYSFFFTISSERFAKGARKMRERRIHSSHVLPKMGCI